MAFLAHSVAGALTARPLLIHLEVYYTFVIGSAKRAVSAYSQSMEPLATHPSSPRGMNAVGIFLLFGAVMACIAGITLVTHGTVLDRMWAVNPRAYNELEPLGKTVGVLFLLLAFTFAFAGVGWLKLRRWGWLLAVVIVGVQVLANFVSIFGGRLVEGGVGLTVAGALLVYIIRPNVRSAFALKPKQIVRSSNP